MHSSSAPEHLEIMYYGFMSFRMTVNNPFTVATKWCWTISSHYQKYAHFIATRKIFLMEKLSGRIFIFCPKFRWENRRGAFPWMTVESKGEFHYLELLREGCGFRVQGNQWFSPICRQFVNGFFLHGFQWRPKTVLSEISLQDVYQSFYNNRISLGCFLTWLFSSKSEDQKTDW